MSEYSPDVWVIVELSGNKVGEPYHRCLAGWYGGYLNGDSWKLNSGITKVEDKGTYYDIHGATGSIYHCHKDSEKFSSYTANIFSSFEEDNCDDYFIKHVSIKDIL